MPSRRTASSLRNTIAATMSGPQALAFMPAFVLGGFWLGGETVLLATALAFPILIALVRRDAVGAPVIEGGDQFEKLLDDELLVARRCLRKTGCLIIEVDDFEALLDRHGQAAAEQVCSAGSTP